MQRMPAHGTRRGGTCGQKLFELEDVEADAESVERERVGEDRFLREGGDARGPRRVLGLGECQDALVVAGRRAEVVASRHGGAQRVPVGTVGAQRSLEVR
jgi:hypothetical protein